MSGFREAKFGDRLSDSAKAKQAQLEKARAKSPLNDPGFAERQAARVALAKEREAREAARKEQKLAEEARRAEEAAAAELARIEAERLAEEERNRAANEEKAKLVQLLADQKAMRDARYAARKKRQR